MREDDRQRATEFVKELYAAGEIDADRLDTGVAGVLAARSEAELAGYAAQLADFKRGEEVLHCSQLMRECQLHIEQLMKEWEEVARGIESNE